MTLKFKSYITKDKIGSATSGVDKKGPVKKSVKPKFRKYGKQLTEKNRLFLKNLKSWTTRV